MKARNLWEKEEEEEEEEMERKKEKKKKNVGLGRPGLRGEKPKKKVILLTYLVFLLGRGQADLPMCQYGSKNWFSLTLVNL